MSRAVASPSVGIVCALPEELGPLQAHVHTRHVRAGLELGLADVSGRRVLLCVSGVGKVLAARAAALLAREEPLGALLVVGVCGGLKRSLVPGTLVHCERAVQADFADRHGREVAADAQLRDAWRAVASGPAGWFLTADRPVLTPWRRLRLARAFAGDGVADMETAAVARVAAEAGVPWAALRAVTDGASFDTLRSFRRHYPEQAGRAAATVPALLERLGPG